MKIKGNHKFLQRTISILLVLTLVISNAVSLTAFAEETEKYPYMLFGRNGITINADNLCMNGNVHTNKEATITASGKNINGKITTGSDIEKRVKHVYSDIKIKDNYFTENCSLYEDGYVRSEMNININNPVFSYGSIFLDGNVALNSNIGTLMNINITGEVKNANTAVVYSKYGDITIQNDSTANINGLIYAPLGTLTINSPNINLNGVIIADKVIINGSSVNINNRDSMAQFIGNTSEAYDFSGLEYLPESWLGDSDSDDLFDIYEKVIDTDPLNPDTDGDQLPDGYEVFKLGTDPLEVDTDANGVLDKDEDFDTDNLNNLGEYQNKTEPFTPDTDEDGLSDGDEVHTYGTQPLIPDTDGDKLLDGEEGYNGTIYQKYGMYFDALNPDTDNDGVCDGDEVFGQSKQQDVTTHDGAVNQVTVDMNTNGNLNRNLEVSSIYNIDLMSTNVVGLIGDPFEFNTTTNFNSATITFKIDKNNLQTTKFEDLGVLWFDEENQKYVVCSEQNGYNTKLNSSNSTISITTTHFSKYMVVDKTAWYGAWEKSYESIMANAPLVVDTSKPVTIDHYNTVFVIDTSGSMSNDPNGEWLGYDNIETKYTVPIPSGATDAMYKYWDQNYFLCYSCNRITACENFIDSMYTNDNAAIITFSNNAYVKASLQNSKDILKGSLQTFSDGGGTCFSNAINKAVEILNNSGDTNKNNVINRIIFLSDGEPENDTQADINSAVSSASQSGIKIYTLGLGTSSGDETLNNIANLTGGNFRKVQYASDLPREIISMVQAQETRIDYVALMDKDTDFDGIPDILEQYGLRPNGQNLGTDYNNTDTDGDELPDSVEIVLDPSKFIEGLENGDCSQGITVPYDPTSKTTVGEYGQIVYEGETYNIDVPSLRSRQSSYWFEPVYNSFSENADHIDFIYLEYIKGKKSSVTDDLHDGSIPLSGYAWNNELSMFEKVNFRNEKLYNISAPAGILLSNILAMINGSFDRHDVTLTFNKATSGNIKTVVITASSNSVKATYEKYANNIPNSVFISNCGSVVDQLYISNYAKTLYNSITGNSIDTSCYYDFVITCDSRHTSGSFANLWIDSQGNVVASPIILDNDKVEIVKRPQYPSSAYLFNYTSLTKLGLTDRISIKKDFITLFNSFR